MGSIELLQRINFLLIFTVMTLFLHKRSLCSNFITFLELSKILFTNYFVNVTIRLKSLTGCLL